MRPVTRLTLAVALVATAGVVAFRLARADNAPRDAMVNDTAAMSELAQREVEITVWSAALAQDSTSALALGQLAALHLQRSREGGSYSDIVVAESLARRSLAHREIRNARTRVTLANALLAQHRFTEARAVADTLVRNDPDEPRYRAVLGEVQMELGDYAAAASSFEGLGRWRTHLSVAPRLARWHELHGDVRGARAILESSIADIEQRRDVPREQAAWFRFRIAELEMRAGRLRAAARHLRAGLTIEPNDPRILGALARLEWMSGHPDRVIELAERAVGITPDPATLGLLSDASMAQGDSNRASEYRTMMEAVVASQGGTVHRGWDLFLLDHGADPAAVLASAEEQAATRRDVYGQDLRAWALYRSGRHADARDAMREALALKTPDAALHYHAGVIQRALGDDVGARIHLERAMALNDRFDPRQARHARLLLDSIARARKRS